MTRPSLRALRRVPLAKAKSLAMTAAALATMNALACGASSRAECDCIDVALRLHVPAERASAVLDVAVSGTACAGVSASCVELAPAGGGACVTYRIAPRAAGYCDVDVDFASGAPRFSSTAKIAMGSACCGGFVADPPSAGDIVVPSDVVDAGGTG
jgi:hypothetical protein